MSLIRRSPRSFALSSVIALAFVAGLAASASASPITLTSADVNKSFSFTVTGVSYPNEISADLSFLLTSWTVVADDDIGGDGDLQLVFQVSVENTSSIDSVLTAIGFNTAPDAESGSSTSTVFTDVSTTTGQFDVCVQNKDDPSCFGNQGNVGLDPGEFDTFGLTLLFDNDLATSIIFGEIVGDDPDGFFARFQSVGSTGSGSDKAFGQPEGFDTPQDPVIPEPTSLLLLGTGLAWLGHQARRRRVGR